MDKADRVNSISGDVKPHRKPAHEVLPLFVNRWSPRAMSGEDIPEGELMALFEAARWAPSAFNEQPWRFIYAKRDTKHWDAIFGLMGEFNQAWTKNAAALAVMISKKTFSYNGSPNATHVFDTGAAWENLALEGARRGLVVHGMSGFDYEKARKILHVPDDYDVCAMCAIGKPGKKEDLPKPMQEREQPSTRKPLSEIAMEGTFRQ